MKIQITPLERISIQEFAKQYGLTMEVKERTMAHWPDARWFALFSDFEIKDGSCLSSDFGNGSTIDEAIENYCLNISQKHGVINAFGPNRKDIYKIPILHHNKES